MRVREQARRAMDYASRAPVTPKAGAGKRRSLVLREAAAASIPEDAGAGDSVSVGGRRSNLATQSRDSILQALATNGLELELVPMPLKSDPEVVVVAVKQNGTALKFAPAELQADRGVALQAVSKCGLALEFCAPALQDEYEIVKTAVHQNPHALRFASPSMKDNRELVLVAVQRNGFALEHAGPLLQTDNYVVLQSVLQLQRTSRPKTTLELYLQRCIEFEAYTTQSIASPIQRFRAVVRCIMRFNRMVNAKLMQLVDGINDGAEDVLGGSSQLQPPCASRSTGRGSSTSIRRSNHSTPLVAVTHCRALYWALLCKRQLPVRPFALALLCGRSLYVARHGEVGSAA